MHFHAIRTKTWRDLHFKKAIKEFPDKLDSVSRFPSFFSDVLGACFLVMTAVGYGSLCIASEGN